MAKNHVKGEKEDVKMLSEEQEVKTEWGFPSLNERELAEKLWNQQDQAGSTVM